MAKTTSYTNLNNIEILFSFNNLVGGQYQPLTIIAQGQAVTPEGATTLVRETQTVGALLAQPATLQQIYTKVNTLNATLGAMVKQLGLDAINIDPSV